MDALQPPLVDAFAAWRSRPVDLAHEFFAYNSWSDIEGGSATVTGVWGASSYAPRMIWSVGMLPNDDPTATLGVGATGAYDDHFRVLAQRLVADGMGNAVIRIGWEMNGSWYRWSAAGQATAYVGYWRHIVAAMRSVAGADFSFVWCVSNDRGGADYYPGDDVVDFVGDDAFDASWVTNYSDPVVRWNDIESGSYGLDYWAAFAAAHGKRFALPEWGVWLRSDGHGGGDDPYYVDQMRAWIDAHDVGFEVYFNRTASDGDHYLGPDATQFPQSAAAYVTAWSAPVAVAPQPDTAPPAAPTGLSATSDVVGRVDLSWQPSADTDVSSYSIVRDAEVIAGVGASTTTYADLAVDPGSSHTYAVIATDAAGNSSPLSTGATVTVRADVTAPSAPSALSGTVTGGAVALSWQAATDDVGVTGYRVFRDGSLLGTTAATSYTDTGVAAFSSYTYAVTAVDAAGNESPGVTVSVRTPAASGQVLAFRPAADTYVSKSAPTTSYGAAPSVLVASKPTLAGLLMFHVDTQGCPIAAATLTVTGADPSTQGGDVYRAGSTAWTESTVTWATAPGAVGRKLASFGRVTKGAQASVVVTAAVAGDGNVAFRITSSSTDAVGYTSKEASLAASSVLSVTCG